MHIFYKILVFYFCNRIYVFQVIKFWYENNNENNFIEFTRFHLKDDDDNDFNSILRFVLFKKY